MAVAKTKPCDMEDIAKQNLKRRRGKKYIFRTKRCVQREELYRETESRVWYFNRKWESFGDAQKMGGGHYNVKRIEGEVGVWELLKEI